MRPIVIILLMVLCLPVRMKAQNYMEHLREHAAGQGTVTVIQSKEIDELVNGKFQRWYLVQLRKCLKARKRPPRRP